MALFDPDCNAHRELAFLPSSKRQAFLSFVLLVLNIQAIVNLYLAKKFEATVRTGYYRVMRQINLGYIVSRVTHRGCRHIPLGM